MSASCTSPCWRYLSDGELELTQLQLGAKTPDCMFRSYSAHVVHDISRCPNSLLRQNSSIDAVDYLGLILFKNTNTSESLALLTSDTDNRFSAYI